MNANKPNETNKFRLNILLKFSRLFVLTLSWIVCFLLINSNLRADGGLYLFPKGAKAEGMGKNGLLNADVWSVYNNQAALAMIDEINAGVNYENRFGVSQLGISSGAFVMPAFTGTFGFDIAHTGIEDYGETRIGVAYGKKLAKKFFAGVQFNYHLQTFATGYPNFYAFTGEIGLIAEPFQDVFIGAHVFNPTFSKLNSKYENPIPVIFRLGVGYKTDKLMVVSELEKERLDEVVPRFGIEYTLLKNLSFRSGFSFKPVEICFGIGWKISKVQLDFAFLHHEILGYSPQIGIAYKFTK